MPLPCVDQLTTREQAALLTWPSVYTDDWASALSAVSNVGVGGVVLMEPNGLDEATVTARISELDSASRFGVIVATDEEGGAVQRLRGIQVLPSQRDVSTSLTVEQAGELIRRHGEMVARVGVDLVLGPVVDVLPANGSSPLDDSRLFAGDPEAVARYARAYVEGWQANGLGAVLKHYPGHGSASGDTHDAAGVTPSLAQLESWDLVPYQRLADTGAAVMVGHLTVPDLTGGLPASLSPGAIAHLRDSLGFADALVISDALDMGAIGRSVPEAAVASIAAGVDIVLFSQPGQASAVVDAIESAVADGVITADRLRGAAARVERLLAARGGGCEGS